MASTADRSPGSGRDLRRDDARGRPGRSRALGGGVAVVAVVGLLGAALALGPGAPAPSPDAGATSAATSTARPSPVGDVPSLAGLEVEIRQGRASWAAREVQVRVLNGTPRPLVVTAASLRSATVAGSGDWEAGREGQPERRVPAGRHRDVTVALGDPVCPAPDGAALAAVVVLDVTDDEGRRSRVETGVGDPQGHLERIAREDCAAATVAEGLEIRLGALRRPTDLTEPAGLEVHLRPVPGGPPVVVEQLDGTVLLEPVPATTGDWRPPELAGPVVRAQVVLLPVRPRRCDAHAVAEDKRGTFVGVSATVDEVPQPEFYVGTSEAVRGDVHRWIGDVCGW